jgi:hypothetical protein
MSNIVVNPLLGTIIAIPENKFRRNPHWMCKHYDAFLISRENCIYSCFECNPTNEIILIIPNVPSTNQWLKPVVQVYPILKHSKK